MNIIDEIVNPKGTPLIYDKYKDYYVGGNFKTQWLFRFENDYGASVIKHFGSYGYEKDLFELAVIFFDGENWKLTYNTPITDDVLGYLTNEEVLDILKRIKELGDDNE